MNNLHHVNKKSDFLWLIVFTVFIFQNALATRISVFRYSDELATVFFTFYTLASLPNLRRIKSSYAAMIFLIAGMLFLGLIGNSTSGISRTPFMIVLDCLYLFKLFFCYIGAVLFFRKASRQRRLAELFAEEIRLIIWIAFACFLISQVVNIGMTRGVRYGIKCFRFVYTSAGMFSQYCILFLVVQTMDLANHRLTPKRLISLILTCLLWLSTCRSRGFVMLAIWGFICFISKHDELIQSIRNNAIIRKLFRPGNLIIMGAAVLILGSGALLKYYGSSVVSARSLLFNNGVKIMQDYFPWGTGFGTYGTETAATFYSPLYYKYGLNTFWALAEKGTELTDCYWPAVCAELGFFGLLLMALTIGLFLVDYLKISGENKFFTIAAVTYAVYMLISSTATGIFASYITAEFIVICVALTYAPRQLSKGY